MGFVKVFISFDMEGVAGIVDWAQCVPPGPAYEEGRALLLGEVNAAIDGAMAAGATEIVCNDSHGTMSNLNPVDLHGRAAYIAGRHIPLPDVELPARLDLELQTADMAQVASWVKGVERTGTRSVRIAGDDPLEVYRSFVGITYITRVSEGR
jgi:D-aminopeptidase